MTTIFGSEVHRLKADVVVIGGGTAGLNTALAAAEMGADVLVVDKAHIQRSGAIAGGIDHFFAYLDTGEQWDTRDAYLAYVAKVARGASNLKIHEKVFCDELVPAMERIEEHGCFVAPTGRENPAYSGARSAGSLRDQFRRQVSQAEDGFPDQEEAHPHHKPRAGEQPLSAQRRVGGPSRLRRPHRRFLRNPSQSDGHLDRQYQPHVQDPDRQPVQSLVLPRQHRRPAPGRVRCRRRARQRRIRAPDHRAEGLQRPRLQCFLRHGRQIRQRPRANHS